jgi:transaldolase
LQNRLGLAVMQKTYTSYQRFLKSTRVQRIMNYGAFPQRLLWASTGTKDPAASDILYVKNLIAPYVVNTMPENTLLAYADHGETGHAMPGSDPETDRILRKFSDASVDVYELGFQLQKEGAEAFNKSWEHLIDSIKIKRTQI